MTGRVEVWRRQPVGNRHVEAFIRYCRRQGDRVTRVRRNAPPGTMDVRVEYDPDGENDDAPGR